MSLVYAETSFYYEDSTIQKVKTVKIDQDTYRHYFKICANDEPVDRPLLMISSDLEEKRFLPRINLDSGNCSIAWTTVQAENPDSIQVKFVRHN